MQTHWKGVVDGDSEMATCHIPPGMVCHTKVNKFWGLGLTAWMYCATFPPTQQFEFESILKFRKQLKSAFSKPGCRLHQQAKSLNEPPLKKPSTPYVQNIFTYTFNCNHILYLLKLFWLQKHYSLSPSLGQRKFAKLYMDLINKILSVFFSISASWCHVFNPSCLSLPLFLGPGPSWTLISSWCWFTLDKNFSSFLFVVLKLKINEDFIWTAEWAHWWQSHWQLGVFNYPVLKHFIHGKSWEEQLI